VIVGASPLVFEGSTVDANRTTFAITDPLGTNTITFPDASGEVSLLGQTIETGEITNGTILGADLNTGINISTTGTIATTGAGGTITSSALLTASNGFTVTAGSVNLTGAVIVGASPLVFEGSTVDANRTTFAITDPLGTNTITFPNASGMVITAGNLSDITSLTAVTSVGNSTTTLTLTANAGAANVIIDGDTIAGHGNLVPEANNLQDLGISGKGWRDLWVSNDAHINDLIVAATAQFGGDGTGDTAHKITEMTYGSVTVTVAGGAGVGTFANGMTGGNATMVLVTCSNSAYSAAVTSADDGSHNTTVKMYDLSTDPASVVGNGSYTIYYVAIR
jgi:hypothetical protein